MRIKVRDNVFEFRSNNALVSGDLVIKWADFNPSKLIGDLS